MNEVDSYLQKLAPEQRKILQHLREMVLRKVPQAAESISYGMPAYKLNGKPLIYFAAFKDHLSIYPAGDQTVESIDGLAAYKTAKGTLHFTEDNLIPDAIVEQLIDLRVSVVQSGEKAY